MKDVKEFSDNFDLWYNNITNNQAPGLNEWEKSVFCTRAQDEVLKSYFNAKGNKFQEGYDGSEKRQIDFSMIISNSKIKEFGDPVYDSRTAGVGSVVLPTDIYVVINESLQVKRGSDTIALNIVPIDYTTYSVKMSEPFKRPLKYQAWRLMEKAESTVTADIIAAPTDTLVQYQMRYLRKPKPIILAKLEGVTIEGYSDATMCELDSQLHEEILQRAVELAKAAYTGTLGDMIALGQNSETNMGIVTNSRQQQQ